MLFGKNSDRERNEAQQLQCLPRAEHSRGTTVRLTYIEIDQAPQTHACLVSRPFWMWGAEMGVNEHGVVIGNEAMHSVIPAERKRALIGMDLVRLALERAANAADAVQLITELLERHGQGGDCGHLGRFYYHNGFIVADPREAYVVETVGRWWAVERVEGVRALSNAFSIGAKPHAVSADLAAHALREGWLDGEGHFDFAERLIDPVRDAASFGQGRCARASALLAPLAGQMGLGHIQAVLRDHGAEAEGDPDWSPAKTLRRSICMHAAAGPRRSQTVASMTSDLTPERITHWVTASSAPCLSLFKPVVLGLDLPDMGPPPTDQFDPYSHWWRHEQFHREALQDFPRALALIAGERDALEDGFRTRMDLAWSVGEAAVANAIRTCWQEAGAAERRWLAALAVTRPRGSSPAEASTARSWARLNTVAHFPR
jgi:dipeptidase